MGITIGQLPGSTIPTRLARAVSAFVVHEGRLADEWRLEEWESLWAEDAHYWIPIGWDEHDPRLRVSIANEDREGIRGRVERLDGAAAYAEEPRSTVRRVIGERHITQLEDDLFESDADFVICSVRREVSKVWGGRVRHRVRVNDNNGLELVQKVVWLVNSETAMHGSGFIF